MKNKLLYPLFILWLVLFRGSADAQTLGQTPAFIEKYSDKLDALVSEKATLTTIADGLDWCEGPLWVESERILLFSDVPQNLIYKWTPEKGKEVYLKPAGYTQTTTRGGEVGSNGLAITKSGQLLICQHGNRQIAAMKGRISGPKPSFKALASSYEGKKFNSPNDMSVAPNGEIYFTDPPYGLEKNMIDPLKEIPFQGVFKINKSGKVILLTDSIERPNGIAVFPGGKSLLIANSFKEKPFIYRYDINEKGQLTNGRIFFDGRETAKIEKGSCDGLKIDSKGNVFASTPGGISIFSPEGELLGKIRISPVASNCSLSADEKTLYITADDHVVQVKLR